LLYHRFDPSTGLDKASVAVTEAAFKVNHNAASSPNLQSAISWMRTMSREHVAEILEQGQRATVVSCVDDVTKNVHTTMSEADAKVSVESHDVSPQSDDEVDQYRRNKRSKIEV